MTYQSDIPDPALIEARNILAHPQGHTHSAIRHACQIAATEGDQHDIEAASKTLAALNAEIADRSGRDRQAARRAYFQIALICIGFWIFVALAIFGLPLVWGWLTATVMLKPEACGALGAVECGEMLRAGL
ncbi:hypothetical protein [Paracoccus shanxieyensis]|uniref:Uncharacterized protein n=1 Tax=Paracoccus shanxieyensis TaxID=2675752 RepID=A0A6L6J4D9_9RHOB|nr:hypothetical protein [Paracoccus shanxieyensis]MTH66728.1 hypothetical protein [Paracoccus shanxieyensis]MTH89963.1 hypothetical protein [Paracoccus shanxieyensis]